MPRQVASLVCVTALLALGGVADAQTSSIGLKFVGGKHTTGPDGAPLLATEQAGLVRQGFWNNVAPWSATMNNDNPLTGTPPGVRANGSASSLVNSLGVTTPLAASWTSYNSYASLNPSVNTPDEKLMDGYIDVASDQPRTFVNLSGIPYPTYDLYLYVGSDGNDRTAFTDVNNQVSTFTWFKTNTGGGSFSAPSDYRIATATNEGAAVPGNVVIYTGLQSPNVQVGVNQGSFNAGFHAIQIVPSVIPAVLRIDLTTGRAYVTGGDANPTLVNSYEVRSSSGSLLPNGLSGFAARGLDTVDGASDPDTTPGNSPGERWEVLGSTATSIVEAFLLGDSSLVPSSLVPLGQVYDRTRGQDPTLTFSFGSAGRARPGVIQYFSSAVVPGDYNRDGLVNAADYTVWRDNLGATNKPEVDGDADGVIDADDYTIWASNYGAAGGAASAGGAAVPEPSSIAFVAAAAGCVFCRRGRIG
ncbi:MAG: hypothetical protein ACRCT8_00310 [Lacipirellulaceae bacterium]